MGGEGREYKTGEKWEGTRKGEGNIERKEGDRGKREGKRRKKRDETREERGGGERRGEDRRDERRGDKRGFALCLDKKVFDKLNIFNIKCT